MSVGRYRHCWEISQILKVNKAKRYLSYFSNERNPLMYFLSAATVLIKEVTNKKRVGIDSNAAAGEMLWGIKYMRERRNTKLVALSIWLLLLLSLLCLNWKEPPRIASAVINTFSFLISLPLSSCVCYFLVPFCERRGRKKRILLISVLFASRGTLQKCLCRHVLLLNEPSHSFTQWIL